jgi:glutathione S-transferase
MKLYNMQSSPFAARCRIQIYAKGLDVDIVEMPVQLPDEYEQTNPIRKVPALEINGRVIPESSVICEYLEDLRGEPSLRPKDPLDLAQMRLLMRVADLYIMEHMEKLYPQLRPDTRDAEVVRELLEGTARGVHLLDLYLEDGPYAVGGALSLADCALVPVLYYVATFCPMFGETEPFRRADNVTRYYDVIRQDPYVARVLDEVDTGLKEAMGGTS